jgi:hypothetical protein
MILDIRCLSSFVREFHNTTGRPYILCSKAFYKSPITLLRVFEKTFSIQVILSFFTLGEFTLVLASSLVRNNLTFIILIILVRNTRFGVAIYWPPFASLKKSLPSN